MFNRGNSRDTAKCIVKLIVREVQVLQSIESHDSGCDQEKSQYQDVLKLIVFVESSSEEHMYELSYRTLACTVPVTLKEIVVLAIIDCDYRALVAMKLSKYKAFIDIMTRRDPIRDFEETSHELWSNNETRKKIIQSDEDARKDLGCSHTAD